jgi:hypothetical protein
MELVQEIIKGTNCPFLPFRVTDMIGIAPKNQHPELVAEKPIHLSNPLDNDSGRHKNERSMIWYQLLFILLALHIAQDHSPGRKVNPREGRQCLP